MSPQLAATIVYWIAGILIAEFCLANRTPAQRARSKWYGVFVAYMSVILFWIVILPIWTYNAERKNR